MKVGETMNFGLEDEILEFKKTTSEINEAIKSICAMLNKHGHGTIYFGVLPNGEAKGQIVVESTLRDISRKIFEAINPQIIPTINKINVDEKEIIEVKFSGNEKPYSCNGVYYIRIADEDRQLSPQELRQLFEFNGKKSWDSALTEYTYDDVDIDSLKKFYNRAIACGRLNEVEFDPLSLLIKLGLMKNNKLTNAGYLLFSKNGPIVLKMAIFATDEKLTFLDINRINGNIITLIDEANSYIKKNMRWKAEIIGFKRVETPEIPLRAIREIICNSFVHARYNTYTEHEISIHPSMIKIYNPGEFPLGYVPEDFIDNNLPSIIRNPLILKTLFLLDDVESYSSGFKRVYNECENANVELAYITSRDGFTFIFKRNTLNDVINGVVSDSINDKLTKDEIMVLNVIKKDPTFSSKKIGSIINKSERSIQRILKSLKERGFIERIGNTKGYWRIVNFNFDE